MSKDKAPGEWCYRIERFYGHEANYIAAFYTVYACIAIITCLCA